MMKQCYLCGTKLIKNVNKSKDHVPPVCIFPDKKPPNLITLPCCVKCNQDYKSLDEKMRNYLSIIANENVADNSQKAQKQILQSDKFLFEFLSHTKPDPSLVDNLGNPRLRLSFEDKEIDKWLTRIVKGLYFYHNKEILDKHSYFNVKKYYRLKPQLSKTFQMEEGLKLRPYFVYKVIKIEEKLNTDFWLLIFYDYIVFSVTVGMPIMM